VGRRHGTKRNVSTLKATKDDPKKLGFIMAIPSKPEPSPRLIFCTELNLKNEHCFNYSCLGQACGNEECTRKHKSLLQMDAEDRTKILKTW
jgi:hypothetical protein